MDVIDRPEPGGAKSLFERTLMVPAAFLGFLIAIAAIFLLVGFGLFQMDKYRAGSIMRSDFAGVAVGDDPTTFVQALNEADKAAQEDTKYGSYERNYSSDNSSVAVRGFWLRSGITCQMEFSFVDEAVSEIGDVVCEGDGWLS